MARTERTTTPEIEESRMEAHRLLEEAESILRDLVGLTNGNERVDEAWEHVERAIESLENYAAFLAGD